MLDRPTEDDLDTGANVEESDSIENLIAELTNSDDGSDGERSSALGYELEALVAIYGPLAVRVEHEVRMNSSHGDSTIRYILRIPLWEQGESVDYVDPEHLPETAPRIQLLVVLPPGYPAKSPPHFQLLGKYLGDFPIDAGLCECAR